MEEVRAARTKAGKFKKRLMSAYIFSLNNVGGRFIRLRVLLFCLHRYQKKVVNYSYATSKNKAYKIDVIDSGASTNFVTNKNNLINHVPHTTILFTAT